LPSSLVPVFADESYFSEPSFDPQPLLSRVGFSLSSRAGKMASSYEINCFVAPGRRNLFTTSRPQSGMLTGEIGQPSAEAEWALGFTEPTTLLASASKMMERCRPIGTKRSWRRFHRKSAMRGVNGLSSVAVRGPSLTQSRMPYRSVAAPR
jgi:hypothetical protein